MKDKKIDNIAIKFAGDSGDGMQLTGTQFTDNTALYGNDFATFPNYPAEIRAPQGTLPGVSGFQIHFGSQEINTPGDEYDVLVAMNAAALKDSIKDLKSNGLLIVDLSGFDKKNLRLAGFDPEQDLLLSSFVKGYEQLQVNVSDLSKAALVDIDLDAKEKDRSKNMFVLGLILWMYGRSLKSVEDFIERKFAKNLVLRDANLKVLHTGYFYGETAELSRYQMEVKPAEIAPGVYRNIMGNKATALGLMTAAYKVNLPLFYGSYPITPASDILHELALHIKNGVKTFQAEDEIAAVCAAIGASFGGALGVTGTSGPGLALKSEAINLALMLELPLVVIDVQRAGPSTGMPTKTEQSDLLFAMYGRNGESPLPIIAAHSPAHCFEAVYWACKIAVEHMTPVIFLSDGFIANGSEPWKIKSLDEMPAIEPNFLRKDELDEPGFLPYKRNADLVRSWVKPGTKGKQHRIGGLEKELLTGNVSYNPENHQMMTDIRTEKVVKISSKLPKQEFVMGDLGGELLIIGWGNSFGAIKSACRELIAEGKEVAQIQIDFINPFPSNLGEIIASFKKVLVPELNNGQLIKLLQLAFPEKHFYALNKVQGIPFKKLEIIEKAKSLLS